jgi:hypothetical protein
MGTKRYSAYVRAQLARVVQEQGRDAEALELLDQAEQEGTGENIRFQLQWRTARAKVLASRGERAAAARLAREAGAIVTATDNVNAQADALVDLAEVLRGGVDEPEAAAALETAVALCQEKGNTLSAGRARDALATVAAQAPAMPQHVLSSARARPGTPGAHVRSRCLRTAEVLDELSRTLSPYNSDSKCLEEGLKLDGRPAGQQHCPPKSLARPLTKAEVGVVKKLPDRHSELRAVRGSSLSLKENVPCRVVDIALDGCTADGDLSGNSLACLRRQVSHEFVNEV